ncbi:hypothetical protein M8A51_14035 [Schlegelella sp. S2-27]|uniref:Uncharacterized protein n=1 Tax=Caldimonas mangrovi TaxID=2944811 RepID=A0ABT0YQV0_9BURK|nr:hypothetical protein [Caldimonas mangrovi]MCM5680642.1 hypothetical protein [Caldimonas mangrovi]
MRTRVDLCIIRALLMAPRQRPHHGDPFYVLLVHLDDRLNTVPEPRLNRVCSQIRPQTAPAKQSPAAIEPGLLLFGNRMSAQLRSRALQKGRIKALRRMKQPMTLVLEAGARDPVARALAQRGSRGAGQHIQSRGAQRRADRVALQALLRREDGDE